MATSSGFWTVWKASSQILWNVFAFISSRTIDNKESFRDKEYYSRTVAKESRKVLIWSIIIAKGRNDGTWARPSSI